MPIGISSTFRNTISLGVLITRVASVASGRAAPGLMQSGVFPNVFVMEVVVSFARPSGSSRVLFSRLRGGKLNVPIFCTVIVAFSWLSTDTFSSLLTEKLTSLSLFAMESAFGDFLLSCSTRLVVCLSLVVVVCVSCHWEL